MDLKRDDFRRFAEVLNAPEVKEALNKIMDWQEHQLLPQLSSASELIAIGRLQGLGLAYRDFRTLGERSRQIFESWAE